MKREIKGFIMGAIATAVILTTSFTAFSESITKTIEATYDVLMLYVDGNIINPKDANGNDTPPFTSNGTTYLPARAIAEALGREVSWDEATKSVFIKNPETEPSVFTVSTAEEFVKAIGSNRRIVMKSGVYDLSKVYDKSENSNVWWDKVSDGKQLTIRGIENLTIEGDTSLGKVEIITSPRYAEIMHFNAGKNISIKNIVAGHTPSEYTCNSGVLGFEYCRNISIDNTELYGCGSMGISLNSTTGLICNNTKIDHCSLRALEIYNSTDIKFVNSNFVDHEAYSNIIHASSESQVSFENCTFERNNKLTWSFVEVYGNSSISFNKCDIKSNTVTRLSNSSDKVYLFDTVDNYSGEKGGTITLKDTKISNNKCDGLYDDKTNVTIDNCIIENNSWQ